MLRAMSEHLIVFCTCPDAASARRIAEELVDRRLAACVNIVPAVTSVYRWQEQRQSAEEWLLIIKTHATAYSGTGKIHFRAAPL